MLLLLGAMEWLGDKTMDLGPRQQRQVLAALAVDAGRSVPIDVLAERVWDSPPAQPAKALHVHVSRIRQLFAPLGVALTHESGGYRLMLAPDLIDLHVFRDVARLTRSGSPLPLERLDEAMALWRGRPFSGLRSQWFQRTGDELQQDYLKVLIGWSELTTRLGHADRCLARLRAAYDEYPMVEPVAAALMRALRSCNRTAEALIVYEDVRKYLAAELGIDPGDELQAMHLDLLRSDPAAPPASVGMRQLPADIADFIGRQQEIHQLTLILGDSARDVTAPPVVTVQGMAGVGKTRLAVHVAHRLVRNGHFADGQLYLDLHGFSEGMPPAEPAQVLATALLAMQVPHGQIPPDADARAALYRERLSGKAVLVVLDNVASEAQVLPLLPGGPETAVLITSRRELAIDGAHRTKLDVFGQEEAHTLFSAVVGPARTAAEPEAVQALIDHCGRLPLAIALTAHRLANRPQWTAGRQLQRLQAAGGGLAELSAGSRHIEPVFDASYQSLDAVHRRAFRLLGVHVGYDYSAWSCAALFGCSPAEADSILETLVGEHLLEPISNDRYRMHDLLRAFAVATAAAQADDDSAVALKRLLHWYLETAQQAAKLVAPDMRHFPLENPFSDLPVPPLVLTDIAAGQRWLDAEYVSLHAAILVAARKGHPEISWRLPVTLLDAAGKIVDVEGWERVTPTAVAASRECDDLRGEAQILCVSWSLASGSPRMLSDLQRSAELWHTLGDMDGEAMALNNLGIAYGRLRQFDKAQELLEAALALNHALGSHRIPKSLGNLGMVHNRRGDYAGAIPYFRKILAIYEAHDNLPGVANTLNNLADNYMELGEYERAEAIFQRAISLSTSINCHSVMLLAQLNMGDLLARQGRTGQARGYWEAALAVAESTQSYLKPDIEELLARHA